MEITKELLLKERDLAKQRYEKCAADVNAYSGAVQMLDYLISLADKEETEPADADTEANTE